ncbi:hypothetical protein BT93_B2839 [Corymbia citriodora subsp. variegata]|nr:hypothetical protein BT93_B2839 [Corymbia citriodora subsp. variegata]
MARGVLFVCLALIAALGFASAAEPATTAGAPATSPSSSSSSSSAFAPVSDSSIGNTGAGSEDNEGGEALAAPVGGPVPAGVLPSSPDGPALAPGSSGASRAVGVSASFAVAAVIGRFF